MVKLMILSLTVFLAIGGCLSLPETGERTAAIPENGPAVVDEDTNIHFTGLYCDECHEGTPVEGGDTRLKFGGDYDQLCRCHHGQSPGYCHPLVIDSKRGEAMNLPAEFPLEEGNFTCNTCHHVYRQCRKRLFNRYTLRGAPYPRKTDFCYRCHDSEGYQALDAHLQILADGSLDIKMCLYCHEEKPDEKTATYEEVTFIGDIKAQCRRCHPIRGNHAGNFDHTAEKPSAEGIKRMEAMKAKFDIILPLTEDGKMTCITCHNPHQKGVIPEDRPAAKGADSTFRHRLPGIMCTECHQK